MPPLLLISNSQLFFEASTSVYKISYANLSVPFVYGVRCARLIKIALLLPSRSVSINESLLKASSSRSSVRIRPNQSLRTIYIRDFPPLATHFTVKNSFCDEICSLPRKFQSRDHVWNLLIELPCANPPTPIAPNNLLFEPLQHGPKLVESALLSACPVRIRLMRCLI